MLLFVPFFFVLSEHSHSFWTVPLIHSFIHTFRAYFRYFFISFLGLFPFLFQYIIYITTPSSRNFVSCHFPILFLPSLSLYLSVLFGTYFLGLLVSSVFFFSPLKYVKQTSCIRRLHFTRALFFPRKRQTHFRSQTEKNYVRLFYLLHLGEAVNLNRYRTDDVQHEKGMKNNAN